MAKNVTLDWTDPLPTTYVTKLEIWRKEYNGIYIRIGEAQLGDETYNDNSGVTDSTKYYYEVRAYNIDRNYSVVENNITITTGTGYLLDTYTNISAAYSLRKLKTGVTSVVKIRRSSDNVEADFTATEITDGTLTTWTGANNGYVTTWYDQSGSSFNATQTVTSRQPLLVSSGTVNTLNSLPSIYFDGASGLLNSGDVQASELECTTWIVGKHDLMASYANLLFAKNTARIFTGVHASYGDIAIVKTGGSTPYGKYTSSEITDLTSYILRVFFDGADYTLAANNSTKTKGTVIIAGAAPTTFSIGYRSDNNSQYLEGDMSELIIAKAAETTNTSSIETDINTHYSIY